MRLVLILAILAVTIFAEPDQLAKSNPRPAASPASVAVSTSKRPDFDSEIKPIFQARCQPCHFPGGKVYAEMPFDKPETIHRLGAKLFTRITDEKERARIREFLNHP